LQRSSLWAVALSACSLACGGSSANSAPAASEPAPATGEAPAAAPATPEASVASTEPAANDAVSAATSAAEAWLQLVDQHQYDQSYSTAAAVFRGAVTQDDWSKAVGGVRGPLGNLVSRKLGAAHYATSLPGAPDGKYVVIQYDTSFEKKASAVETVTPMQDPDGVWRVTGYFVK
jgi:murein L,D-transpeptidase YcbB/YkuD